MLYDITKITVMYLVGHRQLSKMQDIETELELHHPAVGNGRPAVDMEARVQFALEPNLNLWVPFKMQETYFEHGRGTALSTAQYRNYRQFDVTVAENVDPEEGSDRPD